MGITYLLFAFFIPTFAELLVGFVFDTAFSIRLWSYAGFPFNYKAPFIRSEKWGKNYQVGFINLPIVKRFFQEKPFWKRCGDMNIAVMAELLT